MVRYNVYNKKKVLRTTLLKTLLSRFNIWADILSDIIPIIVLKSYSKHHGRPHGGRGKTGIYPGADTASKFKGDDFSNIWPVKSHHGLTNVREKKDTSQRILRQDNGRQHGLISRMLFSELYKVMVKKVTFEV